MDKYTKAVLITTVLFGCIVVSSTDTHASCAPGIGAKTREVANFTTSDGESLTAALDGIKAVESYYPFLTDRVKSSLRQGNFQTANYGALVDINTICSISDKPPTALDVPTDSEGLGCYYLAAIGSWAWHLREMIQEEARLKGMSGGALSGSSIYQKIEQVVLPRVMRVDIGANNVLQFDSRQVEAMAAFRPGVSLAVATKDLTGLPPSSRFMIELCLAQGKAKIYETMGYTDHYQMIPK